MDAARQSIVVVGAGIVGVSAAEWLRRDGHDVTLIDRDEPGSQTSFGNGGVLARSSVVPVVVPGLWKKAPAMVLSPNQPLFVRWSYVPKLLPWLIPFLSQSGPERVAEIAGALAELLIDTTDQHLALARGTPAERRVVPGDYIYLYRSRGDYLADDFAWSLRHQLGLDGEAMDRNDLEDHDPGIGPRYRFGYRMSDHGHIIEPGAYVKELADWFTAQGGATLRAEVRDIIPHDTGARVVCAGATVAADKVVVACGAWSSKLTEKLGHRAMLESERGYQLVFEEASLLPPCSYMVTDAKFVVTPMGRDLRAAGVVEFGGLRAGPSKAPHDLLARSMKNLYPDLEYRVRSQWFGHRPTTSDSLPLLGGSPKHPAVYFAFGHQHVGLTAGPKSGRLIADIIAGREPNIDLFPYRVGRFD